MKNPKFTKSKLLEYVMLFMLIYCFVAFLSSNVFGQQTKRIYMIGNSVTDGVNYYGLDALTEDATGPGNTHIWARHMIPGAPLFLLWNASVARNSGFVEVPFGYPSDAFVNYEWDAITLQPFDRHLVNGDPVTGDGDVAQTVRYANLAKTKSPNVQFYILGRYPRAANGNNDPANDPAATGASWNALHTRAYTGGWDNTNETRDYYEQLTAAATAANPSLSKPFRMIPLGEVMYSLNNKMMAGQVPGYTKIWQFYADGIHLNSIGSYVNACTFYATIYKESPVGRIVPSEYGSIPSALALIIQQTTWEVVSTYAPAGISGSSNIAVTSVSVAPTSTSLAVNQTYQLNASILPSNATNQSVTWTSSNTTIATVSTTGLVTAKAAGTATITVKTTDGNKTATSNITVTSGSIIVTGVSVTPTSVSIKAGNSSTLSASVAPANASNTSVTWTSSNTAIATVDANGRVTAITTGSATITVKTVDQNKTATCAVTIVDNAAPTAVITATPISGTAPLVVAFNSSASTDPDAGDFILGFEWDFGDGSGIDHSTAPSHTYTSAGTYTVKLRVMDNNNLYSSQVTKTITVSGETKLTGTIIGTTGSWANDPNRTKDKVFDGNISTFFDGPTGNGVWAGLDLGTNKVISKVRYYPRADEPARMVNGKFQGSNTIDFSSGVTDLATIASQPTISWSEVSITNPNGFRYVRYLSPNDGYGNVSEVEFYSGSGSGDIQVPSIPSGLTTSSSITQTSFTLNWTASTDNVGVTGYEVFRNGTSISTTTSTSLSLAGLTCGTSYTMTVRARDAAGNWSAESTALNVATSACSGETKLTGTIIGTTGSWANDPNRTRDKVFDGNISTFFDGPTGNGVWVGFDLGTNYVISKVRYYPRADEPARMVNGKFQGSNTVDFSSGVTDLATITSQQPIAWSEISISNPNGFRYVRYLSPNDGYGNVSEVEFYSGSGSGDTQVPSTPSGLTSSSITQTSFTLSWTASTDNVGVTGYEVFRNGTSISTTTSTSLSLADLTCGTSYTMTVRARDAANNWSDQSTTLNVITSACSGETKLTGTIIGTTGSWANDPNRTRDKVFDGNISTFFDAPTGNGVWVGLDLVTNNVISKVRYYPRADEPARMVNGKFQGSNTMDFSSGVTDLATIASQPSISWSEVSITNPNGFRYVRYLSPNGGYGNVSEVEFYSGSGSGDSQVPSIPTGITSASITSSSFTLSWTASTDNVGVTGYDVYSNASLITSVTTASANISDLSASTSYTMTVKAKDAAGNISGASASLNVTTSNAIPSTRTTNLGINTDWNCDYNLDKPWCDAMRSSRCWDKIGSLVNSNDVPKDANGWPNSDGIVLVYAGLKTKNNNGTYKLTFNGQATVTTGDGVLSNQVYNSSTNTTTADLVISDVNNSQLFLTFTNTKKTSASATNTGVSNVTLMRPLTPGSTQSYSPSQYIANDYITKLAPFQTIRYMGWTQTNNGNMETTWSSRVKWNNFSTACLNNKANWESIIIMANASNKDAWICIPHQVDDNFITKLAQMFKYGSDGYEPYTSVQSNPVIPPLNSNLKLYIEYSNEIWNWGGPYTQTPWVRDQAKNFGMPLNFDGTTDESVLMYRYKAMRTVQISTIFRSVFSSEMMTRIRPVICWQQNYNDLTDRTLSFMDRWYNKRDSRSTWSDPHPVNYYLYGGGGSTYWYTDGSTTMNSTNLWDNGLWNPSRFQDVIYNDMAWAKAFGLAYINYEGDAHPTYSNNDETIMQQTHYDARMNAETVEHINAATALDGELFCFLVLQSDGYWGAININDPENSPQYDGIKSVAGTSAAALNRGSVVPFTRPGGAFDLLTYEASNPNGSGTITLSANSDGYKAAYTYRTNTTGTCNVQVEYSTNASATLVVENAGIVIGTFNLASSAGAAAFTSYMNINCTADRMYSIRVVVTSGSVTIRNIIVGSGAKSAEVNQNIGSDLSVAVYPNPATDYITIDLKNIRNQTSIVRLTDLTGKVVYQNEVSETSNLIISTSGISKGVYILNITNELKNCNQKIIVK